MFSQNIFKNGNSVLKQSTRCYAQKLEKKLQKYATKKTISQVESSLANKGFLRPTKAFTAPQDTESKVQQICTSLKIPTQGSHKFTSVEEKFNLLSACFIGFQHSVPNSQIYEMKTVGDVLNFYKTSVSSTVPYDSMKTMDLPPNLHIQYEYLRFNPETDTKFNGKTAFPKSSTLVTGLKYREKYPGHEAKTSWP